VKTETIKQSYKGKDFSYTAQIPESSDEFAQLLGVNCLDCANKEYLNRLKKNLKAKIKDKKLKHNQKTKIQEAVDNFRLIIQGSPAKNELKTMFKGMSEAEAQAAAEAVAKMRESQNEEATDSEADNQQ
jgi:hypothetical protein